MMRLESSFSTQTEGGHPSALLIPNWAFRWIALAFCSIGLFSVSTASAMAGCTEDVVPNSPGSTTSFVHKGYCSTKEEALAQCVALATAHGYPASYCRIGGTANPNAVGAAGGGWFQEQKDGKVMPFHLSIVDYGGAESLPPRLGMGSPTCEEHCVGDPINTLNGNKFETTSVVAGAANGLLRGWSWPTIRCKILPLSASLPEYLARTDLSTLGAPSSRFRCLLERSCTSRGRMERRSSSRVFRAHGSLILEEGRG